MYSLFINLLDAAIVIALEEEEGEEIVVLPFTHRKEGDNWGRDRNYEA